MNSLSFNNFEIFSSILLYISSFLFFWSSLFFIEKITSNFISANFSSGFELPKDKFEHSEYNLSISLYPPGIVIPS